MQRKYLINFFYPFMIKILKLGIVKELLSSNKCYLQKPIQNTKQNV